MVKMFHIVIINHFEDSDEHLLKHKYEIALFRWVVTCLWFLSYS